MMANINFTDLVQQNETEDNGTELSDHCALSAYTSHSTYEKSRLVVDVGLVLLLCTFGLVGNGLSFCVLGNMKGGTTPWLLRTLAVADSVYLFTCLFFQAGMTMAAYVTKFRQTFPLFPYVERYIWSLAAIAQMTSVWMVVLVTTNRWVAICYPLRAKQTATNRNAGTAVAVVVLSAVLFNIPTFFELEVVHKYSACTNTTRLAAMATKISWNPVYQLVYKTILCFLVRAFIPLALLIFLNARLVKAIRSSASFQGRETREQSNARNRLTKLVVGVVSVFIVCELPDVIFRVLLTDKLYRHSSSVTWPQLAFLGMVVNFMLTVNAAVNFLIYFVLGKTFRQSLQRQCCYHQNGAGIHRYQGVNTSSAKSTMVGSWKSSRPV